MRKSALPLILLSLLTSLLANSARTEDYSQFYDDYANQENSNLPNVFYLTEVSLFTRPYLEISAGSLPGVTQSYTTLGTITYLPIHKFSNSKRLWSYTDTCWYHFLKGSNGASIEEGLVWQTNCCYFGGYIGYDWRRWSNHSFNQVSFGLMMVCNNWNLSLNMNYPLEEEHVNCFSVCDYEGGFQSIFKDYDATYRTLSLTLGRTFCTNLPYLVLSAGIEPYYLATNSKNLCGCSEKGWGGKARFLLNMCNIFHTEVLISHDEIFSTRAQITIGIDLLQAFSNCSCDYPFYPIFQRQKIIPIKHKESCRHNW